MRYSREGQKNDTEDLNDAFNSKAALYAEFAKIVCITIGKIVNGKLKLKTFAYDDEHKLLSEFSAAMAALMSQNRDHYFITHAGTGFDIPFIMRRCIINRIEPPVLVDVAHLKPWELTSLDTLTMWKATGFYGASLINIATALGLPSPKVDMDGSETSDIYWETGDISRIARYCESDVLTTANIFLAFRLEDPIEVESGLSTSSPKTLEAIANSGKVSEKDRETIEGAKKKLKKEDREIADNILKAVGYE